MPLHIQISKAKFLVTQEENAAFGDGLGEVVKFFLKRQDGGVSSSIGSEFIRSLTLILLQSFRISCNSW